MKLNKTQKVMRHLLEIGHITSWEAIKEYGATRLSGIIYNLRHKYGMNIVTEKVQFIDRYGDKSYFGLYVYKGDKDE